MAVNFTLSCKTLTGDQLTVEATGGMTIAQLTQIIATELGTGVDCVRLMHLKKLEKGQRPKYLNPPTETLAHFGILSNSKIKVVVRMSNVVPKQDCTLEVEGMPRSVCLSNDDKYSICGTYGGKFYVFNTSTGELVADCAAHSGKPIRRIKFNKAGTHFATAGGDNTAKLWAFDGKEVSEEKVFELHGSGNIQLWTVSFSNDGTLICAGGSGSSVAQVFSVDTGEQVSSMSHSGGTITCCQFNSDGSWVVSGSSNRHLVVWDPNSGEKLHELDNAITGEFWNVHLTRNDEYLFTVGCGSSICMWRTDDWTKVKEWTNTGTNDISLLKNDTWFAFFRNRKGGLSLVDIQNVEEDPILIEGLTSFSPEQICNSHYKNCFIFHTGNYDNPTHTMIPEEEFLGRL